MFHSAAVPLPQGFIEKILLDPQGRLRDIKKYCSSETSMALLHGCSGLKVATLQREAALSANDILHSDRAVEVTG
jgi:hypothetical protein